LADPRAGLSPNRRHASPTGSRAGFSVAFSGAPLTSRNGKSRRGFPGRLHSERSTVSDSSCLAAPPDAPREALRTDDRSRAAMMLAVKQTIAIGRQ